MNRTIWKFTLAVTDVQVIPMPRAAKLLTVQEQQGELCLWAEVNADDKKVERVIFIYGTGHPMPAHMEADYLVTVQTYGGRLVWHVYDGGER
jgi:hypothetical protein